MLPEGLMLLLGEALLEGVTLLVRETLLEGVTLREGEGQIPVALH